MTVTDPPPPSTGGSGGSSTPKPNTSQPAQKPSTSNNSSSKKAAPAPVQATVKATSGDTSPPSKPENFLAIVNDDNTIGLSWSPASDNIGVTSYVLERSVDAVEWQTLTADSTQTSYTDSDLSDTVNYYYYRLRAQDAVGNQSEAAFVDIEYAQAVASDSDEENAVVIEEPSKKGSGGKLVGFILGGLVLIAAIVAAIIIRKRRNMDDYNYGYSQDAFSSQPMSQTPTYPSQPPNVVTPQAPQTPQGVAPHTSKSLKDMVLEDFDPNNPNGPSQSPPTPHQ